LDKQKFPKSCSILNFHFFDKFIFTDEAIKQVEDYIEYIVSKHNLNNTSQNTKKPL